MKLTFKNGAGEQSEIEIQGKCKITDYDTRYKSPEGEDLTIEVDDEDVNIMTGTELKQDSQTVTMNANKYSIFTAIAAADGDDTTLTQNDIAIANKSFKNGGALCDYLSGHGVKEIIYEERNGVATIVIGDNELLRIDFKTWWEKLGSVVSTAFKECTKDNPVEELEKPEVQRPEIEYYNISLDNVVSLMNKGQKTKMTAEQLNANIKEIADRAGCSESLVRTVIATESFSRRVSNPGDNQPTGGFGHVLKSYDKSKGFKMGSNVTNEQAFTWLENDICFMIDEIKKQLSQCDWDKIPTSLQSAIIDIAFNSGPYTKRIKNLGDILLKAEESGSYIDAAIYICQVEVSNPSVKGGVMKRNCYRFLMAIEDFPAEERLEAMRRYSSDKDSYYSRTIANLPKRSGILLKEDWLEVQHTAEKELGLYEEPPGIKYIVQSGDNWWKIATDHNITVDTLKKFNSNTGDSLVIGQRLRIPPKSKEQDKEQQV